MKPKEISEVCLTFEAGKKLQHRIRQITGFFGWHEGCPPRWDFEDYEVRVKPKSFEGRAERTIFDKHFRNPGDETKPELQALRASLPD